MTRHCRRPLIAIAVFVGFTAYLAAAAMEITATRSGSWTILETTPEAL